MPAVRFREGQDDLPPTPSTHEDSISESELSDVTFSIDGALSPRSVRSRRPRRASRKGTAYYLGYPAPRIIGKTKVVQKVLLPRLLLQLQQVSQEGRSKPVLEVFPALRITGPVVAPRLTKKFPGIFGVKRHLGCDDIVLLRRDDGDASWDGPDSEAEESMESRELLAVFSPLKHSNEAELVLNDGSVWMAKPLPNGNFDFVHTDADGKVTTARWARRQTAGGAVSPTTDSSISSTAPQARYTFSIINPLTRRHPVMATLTPSTLNVFDTYTSVSPSHARQRPVNRPRRSQSVTSPPTSPPTPARVTPYSPSDMSLSGSTSDGENGSAICIPPSPEAEASNRTVHPIDDRTKTLISITALWVCLQSGWPQSHHSAPVSNGETAASSTSLAASSTRPRGRSRRNTWTTRSSSASDTPQSPTADPSLAHGNQPSRETAKEAAFRKRSSMPVPVPTSTHLSGEDIGGVESFTPLLLLPQPPRQQLSPARPPTRRTTVSTALDSRPPHVRSSPKRATSLGAAFMRKRLLASSSSSNSTVDRGEAPEQAGTVSAKPQLLPSLATTQGEGGTIEAETAPQGGEKPLGTGVGVTLDSAACRGSASGSKKSGGGARSKLVRWMYKLRSSSSR
ncbi:hypothetical protein MYCTH_2306684 [Thermothelomyces thermophilus ATCC 42464]|uniref:Uncharacterized protein n=1 Tax=Thermothelomyces thermophilus (strain ATCC 42464 / BCRC 31852 / DSM 1799) TaxID=573729 RepID=G2QHR6_THET4|nr:uncharacterized protein MYCTH_2306684 [Thermothelomyces thermophilus ATCC 42464]AEO58926.1 hypothetical protein MYCTH_2306684 [Thermothelomyces thermophilus ATCC 42464]